MKLRKIIASFLVVTILGVSMPAFSTIVPSVSITASAEEKYTEETYGSFRVKKYGSHVEISKYNSSAAKVEIPSKIDDLPVTSIGNEAFSCCYSLTSITIMNPDCKIADNRSTISNSLDNDNRLHIYDGVIKGYDGSTAEAYANKYAYKFESLGNVPVNCDVDGDDKITANNAPSILIFYTYLSGNGTESDIKVWLKNLN